MERVLIFSILTTLVFSCAHQKSTQTKTTEAPRTAPHYPPSGWSEKSVDITTNAYGAWREAPNAPGIGDVIPSFELKNVNKEVLSSTRLLNDAPLVLIFFRGFW